MDSYPPEFVLHLQPTLIITGLAPASTGHQDVSSQAPASSDGPPPPPPRPAIQDKEQQQANSSLETQKAALLQAMLSRNNVSYWDNTKGLAGSLYYVVSERRGYILPPTRKFLQQTGQQHSTETSFSPSSPSSPLYPDGLMTPLWIKRHRKQIPSVFIAVVNLWDRESVIDNGTDSNGQRTFSDKGPLGVVDPMERENDTILAQELLERRKAAQERYVKFAAVILLQKSHMQDPSLEDRLNFVRKSAGLDIKNSFYVLPPSNNQEISDFAVNLQRSQYEGSMNYYKEQVKRHKKKKSNLPATTASIRPAQQQSQQQQQQQGLSVQGWMLRYEFKMGVFSECKQDIDNAIKHYESAYGLLIDMFAVTSIITPGASGLQSRTKRWAEAKVLADCLCLKICKFHLYLDAPSTALFCFRRHLTVFKAFSETWRMGDDSFEYWAWLAKQYRMLGDLIDVGIKAGFKLPPSTPGSIVYGSFAGLLDGSKDLNKFSGISLGSGTIGFGIGQGGEASAYGGSVGGGRGGGTHGPGAGINPMLVLQHAGFFYHQAANCNVQRRLRFEIAEEAYPDSNVAPVATANRPYPPSLQSMNAERAIDHHSTTIELLTKSYEQFKRYKAGRMTLFLASEIAGTYYAAGKFEMALKFFERIGKTYRKEGWNLILTSILKWSVQCAKQLGFWETVVECLVEMMSPDMPSTTEKRQISFDELVSILYDDTHPANNAVHKPLVLTMPQINSFAACAVQFQKRQTSVSSQCRFQVQVSTPGGEEALPKPFRISYIHVEFSDATLNHFFEDPRPYTDDESTLDAARTMRTTDRTGKSFEWIDCTQCTFGDTAVKSQTAWKKNVSLDIRPFETKVLEGVIVPATEQVVKVLKVTLGIVSKHWNIALEFPSQDLTQDQDQTQQHHHMPSEGEPPRRQWLEIQDPTADTAPKLRLKNLDQGVRRTTELCIVPRESKVEIKALFKSPAYLDEYFPVKIKVRNGETCPVTMELDVDLQPMDSSIESQDSIVLNPQEAADSTLAGTVEMTQTLKGIRLGPSSTTKGTGVEGDEIPVGQWAEQIVYVKALEIPSPRTIVCKVRYPISLDKDQTKTWTEKQYSFRVLFIPPFDAGVDYILQPKSHKDNDSGDVRNGLPLIMEANQVDERHGAVMIPALMQKEDYLMSTRINNEGPWPIEVKEVSLITSSVADATGHPAAVRRGASSGGLSRSHSLKRPGERKTLQEAGVRVELIENGNFAPSDQAGDEGVCVRQWKPSNLQSFNYLIRVVAADLELAPEQIDVGFLRIRWRRVEEDDAQKSPYTLTDVQLQPLTLPKAEVYMTVDLPKFAKVNKPFTAKYEVHNPTSKLHELSMTVEQSEGMVFAGTMQTTIRLLPYASHPIQMTCYPINAGLIRLPKVKLVINKRQGGAKRGNPAPAALQQGVAGHEEVVVKVRGATNLSSSLAASTVGSTVGVEAVAIFVKPEAGLVE